MLIYLSERKYVPDAGKYRDENAIHGHPAYPVYPMKERGMMSQKQRLIQLALPATVLLGLLVGVYLIAWRRLAKPAPTPTIVKHSLNASSDDALKYWTVDKMRDAKPVELPKVKAVKPKKRRSHKSEKQHS
jgi:hypothetical protein